MTESLYICSVDPAYLRFLHSVDDRVSVKYNNRPFVGVVLMMNGSMYVLPLTSQTTASRLERGAKKRSAAITTFVRSQNAVEIANILHNNMIPVTSGLITKIDIDAKTQTYEANEIRFIRKHADEIISKAQKVYAKRISGEDPFMNRICCDFAMLEAKLQEYLSGD